MPLSRSLLVLSLSFPVSLAAQADSARAVVEGKILDPVGSPLAQTEIIWQTDRRSVMSRADGSFNLVVPVRGPTLVLVRRRGYSAQVLRVDLTKGMWRGNIVLQPGSYRLPEVVVDAKYAPSRLSMQEPPSSTISSDDESSVSGPSSPGRILNGQTRFTLSKSCDPFPACTSI